VQRDRVGAGGGLDGARVGAVRRLIFSALGSPVNRPPAILIVTWASSSGAYGIAKPVLRSGSDV
jgi:hypothetical protein